MRVAVFTNQFPSRVSTFFARDLRSWIDAGMEVDVFPIYPLDPALWSYVPDLLDARRLPHDRVHHLDARDLLRRGLAPGIWRSCAGAAARVGRSAVRFGAGPLVKSEYVLLKAALWASRHPGRYDHVIAYWGSYAATAAWLFHRLACPAAPFTMFLHAGADLYRDQVFLREKLEYADTVVVVCEFNRSFLNRLYPDLAPRLAPKIRLHHLGLDLRSLPFSLEGRVPGRIAGVGAFERSKGFDDLLRAAASLARCGRDVSVELAGDGPEGARLRQLASELGIGDRVRFTGWLPFAEVARVLSRATALVHPSIGLGDAVPTVIKEAMAMGTVVVATEVAGIPELLDGGRCGVLAPPRDVRALANAIDGVLHDPLKRVGMAAAARAYAEEMFDLDRNAGRLVEALRATARRPLAQGALMAGANR
jgi:glycosyltransferase involved in cell wall biosynthesis